MNTGGSVLRLTASLLLNVAALLPLASGMRLDGPGFVLALALYYPVFGFVLSAIEATVFSSGPGPIRGRDWGGGVAIGVLTALVAVLCVTTTPGADLRGVLGEWGGEPGSAALARRVAYASLSFMVVYCVIGSATWPFVRNYYEDPASPLKLRVPSARVILPLQLARGLLATCVLLPLIAAQVEPGAPATWIWLSLSVAVTSSVVPLLNAQEWPLRLRVIHCIEISVFSFVQGGAWWWFLCR